MPEHRARPFGPGSRPARSSAGPRRDGRASRTTKKRCPPVTRCSQTGSTSRSPTSDFTASTLSGGRTNDCACGRPSDVADSPRSGCVTLTSSSRAIPICSSGVDCGARRSRNRTDRWCPGRPSADRRGPGPSAAPELVENRPEDVVRLIAAVQEFALRGGAELVSQIVQRAQRPRRRQRITRSPQHPRDHRPPARPMPRRTMSCPRRIHRIPSPRHHGRHAHAAARLASSSS